MSRSASPEERYQGLVDELVRQSSATYAVDPPVDQPGEGRRFGSYALKTRDRIFAMLVRGRLVVKLPRQRVNELIASGAGERFDPGHGRLMKEWLVLEPAADADWLSLATEALEFVGRGR
jgi:hypothetical protein